MLKRLIACLLSATGLVDASVLQAKTGPPVVQELMGGCSLTCSFPWNAEASKEKLAALNDSEAATAWTGARVGDALVFRFPKDLPRELNGTPFYGIDVANGRQRPAEEFTEYGRIKAFRLSHNGKPVHTIRLADTRRWQQVEFDDIFLNVGDTIALEILEVYPGKKFPTAALTEIVLQGAH
jgi:hypothetical protein